jgi:hypothetical protein
MPSSRMCPREKILRFSSPSAIQLGLRRDLSSRSNRVTVDAANEHTRGVALAELVAPSQPERSRDTCRLASPPRPELAGVCHSSRDGGGMEGIAAERPGWHSLRRNGLAAGHGEASGIGIHVTSPWPPKTPPSRPLNGRTTRQIDTNETRPRFRPDTNETRPRFRPFLTDPVSDPPTQMRPDPVSTVTNRKPNTATPCGPFGGRLTAHRAKDIFAAEDRGPPGRGGRSAESSDLTPGCHYLS